MKQTSTIYYLCQTEQMWNKYFWGRGVVKMESLKAQAHLMHPFLYIFLLGLPGSTGNFFLEASGVFHMANFPWRYFVVCLLSSW